MLAIALSAALHLASASTPSAANLASKTWLSQAPSDAPVAAPPVAAQPVKSLFELNRELQQLERDRPGMGFPIAFIAIGGAGLLIDGLLTIYSVLYGLLYYIYPALIVIGVAALVGFVGVGFMMLAIRLSQRAKIDQRMDEIRAELDRRQGEHPYGLQPGQDYPPPPPPPPPPPVGFAPAPVPQLVLAEF